MGDGRTPWFRLATDFWRNHKVANAGFLAGSLHLAGIAHSAEQLTDGFIPDGVVPILAAPMHGWVWVGEDGLPVTPGDVAATRPYALADALCAAGLWQEVDGGYQIVGYLEHQPSRAEVEKARTAQSEAGKRGAAKRWRKPSNGDGDRAPNGVPDGEPHKGTNGEPVADPMANRWGSDGTYTSTSTEVSPSGDTPPVVPRRETSSRSRRSSTPDRFDEFWSAYPRRVGKQAAIKAWRKAVELTNPDTIIEGARQYAAARDGEDPKYTAHPSTWLNAGRWDDEPEPRYTPPPKRSSKDEKVAYLQSLKSTLADSDDGDFRALRALPGGV